MIGLLLIAFTLLSFISLLFFVAGSAHFLSSIFDPELGYTFKEGIVLFSIGCGGFCLIYHFFPLPFSFCW